MPCRPRPRRLLEGTSAVNIDEWAHGEVESCELDPTRLAICATSGHGLMLCRIGNRTVFS